MNDENNNANQTETSPYRLANILGINSFIFIFIGVCLPIGIAALISLVTAMRSVAMYRKIEKRHPAEDKPILGLVFACISILLTLSYFIVLATMFFLLDDNIADF